MNPVQIGAYTRISKRAARGVDTIAGNEHKASYKTVTSSRIDTTALKKAAPDIAAQYTKTTQSKRFIFA